MEIKNSSSRTFGLRSEVVLQAQCVQVDTHKHSHITLTKWPPGHHIPVNKVMTHFRKVFAATQDNLLAV